MRRGAPLVRRWRAWLCQLPAPRHALLHATHTATKSAGPRFCLPQAPACWGSRQRPPSRSTPWQTCSAPTRHTTASRRRGSCCRLLHEQRARRGRQRLAPGLVPAAAAAAAAAAATPRQRPLRDQRRRRLRRGQVRRESLPPALPQLPPLWPRRQPSRQQLPLRRARRRQYPVHWMATQRRSRRQWRHPAPHCQHQQRQGQGPECPLGLKSLPARRNRPQEKQVQAQAPQRARPTWSSGRPLAVAGAALLMQEQRHRAALAAAPLALREGRAPAAAASPMPSTWLPPRCGWLSRGSWPSKAAPFCRR